jgi:hypothetical protein
MLHYEDPDVARQGQLAEAADASAPARLPAIDRSGSLGACVSALREAIAAGMSYFRRGRSG